MLEAKFRLLFQSAEDDGVKAHVDMDPAHALGRRSKFPERQFAGEHFVKDHAEGIDIGAVIDLERMLDLLGRHVVWRAHDVSFHGEAKRIATQAEDLGEAEVGDFHAPFAVDEDILRLDVAVHDAFVVGVLQRVAELRNDLQRPSGRKLPGLLELPQIYAIDVFHDEVVHSAGFAELVHRNDGGVTEAREGAGFAIEAIGKAPAIGGLWREDFQGDEALEGRLARFVHGAHASLAEERNDFELREKPRDFLQRRRREGGTRMADGFNGCAFLKEASRAKSLEDSAGKKRAAARTLV